MRQRLDRRNIGAGEDRLGHATTKPSSRKRTELARVVCGGSPKRPEATPPGKGTGRGQIGVARARPQTRDGIGDIVRGHSLGRQPCPHSADRLAAAMQRLHPRGGVGRIVEQACFAVARDERVDQHFGRTCCFGGAPSRPPPQHAPQVLGRTGITPEIVKRPTFEEIGSYFTTLHLWPHSWFAIGYGPGPQ